MQPSIHSPFYPIISHHFTPVQVSWEQQLGWNLFFSTQSVTISSLWCSFLWTARESVSFRREPIANLGNCTHDLLLASRCTCQPPKARQIVDILIDISSICAGRCASHVNQSIIYDVQKHVRLWVTWRGARYLNQLSFHPRQTIGETVAAAK